MIATLFLALTPFVAPQDSVSVEITREHGDVFCDIRAHDVSVHKVMKALCQEAGIGLSGFEDVESSPEVSVYLRHRPLNVAVNYVLGAAGLSGQLGADRLDVSSANPPFPSRQELLQIAEISFLSTLQQFPTGVHAERARNELAQIAVLRGEPEKAARHYELLIESTKSTEVQLETRMKAGRLLVDTQKWSRAMPHFRFVAETVEEQELEKISRDDLVLSAEARRELARCVLMRGDSMQALHMLRALEHLVPATDNRDAAERLLLLARAEVGIGQPVDAMRSLERARDIGREYVNELDVMDLRAQALELQGKHAEAALAWLHFSRGRGEVEKREALVRAAKIALATEDEYVFLIMLHKYAENEGLGQALLPYVNEARARLGLSTETFLEGSLSISLHRAVRLVDQGETDQAARAFAALASQYKNLSADDRVTFALNYAPLVDRIDGVSFAIDLLRDVVRTLESVENRSRLYKLAGEIYERHERFDDAAAAYGGRL